MATKYEYKVTNAGSALTVISTTGGMTPTTLAATDAVTAPSVTTTAGLNSTGATGAGVGYATGAGGAVTQITSITTGVTLSKLSGTITTVSSTLAAGADATFIVTNTAVAATDVVVASVKSYGGTSDGIPVVNVVATAAGSYTLNIRNTGAVTLDAIVLINVAVVKAVAA